MSDTINIKKGLDIPLSGKAQPMVSDARSTVDYAVKPVDYVGVTPKLLVAEGDVVKAGSPLFYDKNNTAAQFVSPVSGTVKAIVRGEKRALLAVVVSSDNKLESVPLTKADPATTSREQLKKMLIDNGLWPLLRRRPFGTIALETDVPKAIFVSCFDSAPLGPDFDFVMEGRDKDFIMGLQILARLTDGKVHLSFRPGQQLSNLAKGLPQVESHFIKGPHPAGNVGTQIAAISPINKGEVVWTLGPQDVAIIGHAFLTGEYRPEKVVAFVGPCATSPRYYRLFAGACVATICKEQLTSVDEVRLVSGNVLSGTQITPDGFLGAYDSLLCAIPEGDYYEFMGWMAPGFRKFSFSRTFLSGFFAKCHCHKKSPHYNIDTNLHGEPRPLVVTGNFEQVFPFKIYPLQLLKAAIIGDIDLMENLGIYEVEPEDFALCEFIDPSKTEIQSIIRQALENIRKEGM